MSDALQDAKDSLRTPLHLPLETTLIGLDFDSTCVKHAFPDIGPEVPGCVPILKELSRLGAKLILFSVRDGVQLHAARIWFSDRGIDIWGVNHNPIQHRFSASKKVYADFYIDDRSLGIPLIANPDHPPSPYVDWYRLKPLLEERLGITLGRPE